MANVLSGKNTLAQPTNTNGTPTDRESNDCDLPSKDASDAPFAPGFGWSSSGPDCEWICPPFEHGAGLRSFSDGKRTSQEDSHNETPASGSHFLGQRPSTPKDLHEDFSWAGTGFGCLPSVEQISHDIENLLEEDLVFRLATSTGSHCSSVRRGLETNLAELQVAGDVVHPPSMSLEEGWSRLSTPALSVTSDLTDEALLPIPPTPRDELSVVPAVIVVARDLTPSPPAEAPTVQEPGPSEEAKVFDSQLASGERQPAWTGRKRKRDAPELDDACASRPRTPLRADDEHQFKWFSIEGRSKPRHSTRSEVTVHTKYGESCCSRVGNGGYCQFEWSRNGKTEKCGIELIRDRDMLTAHLALHFEDLGYYTMAGNNPEWRPRCPWCNKRATTFDNFTRHISYTELEINVTRCGCGGTVNRGNQARFRARHEETSKHREWVMRSRAAETADSVDEPDEEQPEFVQGCSRVTEWRRSKAKVAQSAGEEEYDEEQEEFIEGSSTGTARKRSSSRKMRAVVKEEPDEEQGELIQSRSTGATRKRRKAKKTKTAANEDPDEEQEEFVEGSSTGSKCRRLR